MTVKQLIEKLKTMPQNATVYKTNEQADYYYTSYDTEIEDVVVADCGRSVIIA